MKPNRSLLKRQLTRIQYSVTQKNATEPPFNNAYWNNHRAGVYVDIVSGEPLFSSLDKFDSGTGWPCFTKPLEPNNILESRSKGIFNWLHPQIEVRSKQANSHLGHLFHDGPQSTQQSPKLRYCINSAALRFIPAEELSAQGYSQYLFLFPEIKPTP